MENEQTTRLMSLDNRLSRTNELLERLVSALENPSPS
jgi:hypothetical protein